MLASASIGASRLRAGGMERRVHEIAQSFQCRRVKPLELGTNADCTEQFHDPRTGVDNGPKFFTESSHLIQRKD
jgi:hypothetical protein